MASRLIALVEHPAREGDATVDVVTRRRMGAKPPYRPCRCGADAAGCSTGDEDPEAPELTTTAVVLAAGAGSRFGGGKLLASLEGRPVLQHVLDRVAEAGIGDVVVVLGDDADRRSRKRSTGGRERRVRNPDPARGLSSSVRVGMDALGDGCRGALIVLGDQPIVSAETIRALLDAPPTGARPIVVPVMPGTAGATRCCSGRDAFGLARRGDRRPRPRPGHRGAPGARARGAPSPLPAIRTWTRARTSSRCWRRPGPSASRDNAEQVDRLREVPDGTDFYAPVTGLFRADPTRTDEPVLVELLRVVRAGETWLDIGAGAGRYALPLAAHWRRRWRGDRRSTRRAAMLGGLRETAAEHDIDNVRVVEGAGRPAAERRSRPTSRSSPTSSYDIEAIGPFVAAMESAAGRLCIAMLMERQPSSIADVCWPPVWGEDASVAGASRVRRAAARARPRAVDRDAGARAAAVRVARRARGLPASPALGRRASAAEERFRAALDDARRHRCGWSRRARRPAAVADRDRDLGAGR